MWTEYDHALSNEDLEHALITGYHYPVLLRLSVESVEGQAIFETIHRKTMRQRGIYRGDHEEAVTEVVDVTEASQLLRKHLGARGLQIVHELHHAQVAGRHGRSWSVISVLCEGVTHERHCSRTTNDPTEPVKLITIDVAEAGSFTLSDDPVSISHWFLAALLKTEKMKKAVQEHVTRVFVARLEDWPWHIASVIEVLRVQKRKTEKVVRGIVQADITERNWAAEVEAILGDWQRLHNVQPVVKPLTFPDPVKPRPRP